MILNDAKAHPRQFTSPQYHTLSQSKMICAGFKQSKQPLKFKLEIKDFVVIFRKYAIVTKPFCAGFKQSELRR